MIINKKKLKLTIHCLLAFLVFGNFGCASKQTLSFGPEGLGTLTDEVAVVTRSDCSSISGRKIYTKVVSESTTKEFLENYNLQTNKIFFIPYNGNFPADVESKLKNILQGQCGAIIVEEATSADHKILLNVEKYYSQILKAEKTGSEASFNMSGEEISGYHADWATQLAVVATIDGEEIPYNHNLQLRVNVEMRHNASGVPLLGSTAERLQTNAFSVDFDGITPLANGTFAQTLVMGQILGLPKRMKVETAGQLSVFDRDTGREFVLITVDNTDFPTAFEAWKDPLKKEYYDLYGSSSGNLKFLMYDFAWFIVKNIN